MPEPISPQPTTPTVRMSTERGVYEGLNWRGLVLAAGGLLLTFAAPGHRVDLLAIGVIATFAGVVWSPMAGPLLIGAALPTFFFSRGLVGPLSVTPPGLTLVFSWTALTIRRKGV